MEDSIRGDRHEFYRPWVLWEHLYRVAPEASIRFAEGLWGHQIGDHDSGNFSQLANYSRHNPGGGRQSPLHGGYYISAWTYAYKETQDPKFLNAIEKLVGLYEHHRNADSDAIPEAVGTSWLKGVMYPQNNLSLAVDLGNSSEMLPEKLATRMRKCAAWIDKIYLELPHSPEDKGKGFVTRANVQTLEAKDMRKLCRPVYTCHWLIGESSNTHAKITNLYMLRYKQNQNEEFKRLILKSAENYFNMEKLSVLFILISSGSYCQNVIKKSDNPNLPHSSEELPNILWIVSEDNSPFLGCYGDELATTPNLDKLTSEGFL